MKKQLFLLPFLVLIAGCSSNGNDKKTDILCVITCEDYPDDNTHNYSKTLQVSDGGSIKYQETTNNSYCYLLGVYVDDSDTLVKMSQLESYDGSFKKLTFKYSAKQNNPNYLSRYNGQYLNRKGDVLIVQDNVISFDFTVAEGVVIHFRTSTVCSDGLTVEHTFNPSLASYFAPYANSLFLNDELVVDRSFSCPILSYGEEFSPKHLVRQDLKYNCFDLQICENAIKQYCDDHGYSYDEEMTDWGWDTMYYAHNNITIDYDL